MTRNHESLNYVKRLHPDPIFPIGKGMPSDNDKNDVSFIATPGGTLNLIASDLDAVHLNLPIGKYSHSIKVHNLIIGLPDTDPTFCIQENTRRTKEIYAQNHIEVQTEQGILTTYELEDEGISGFGIGFSLSLHLEGLLAAVDKKIPSSSTMKLLWLPVPLAGFDANDPQYGYNCASHGRPDVCLLFLPSLNTSNTVAIKTSHTAAHEMGHGLGIATEMVNGQSHTLPDGTPYPGFHLMSSGSNSNYIIPSKPDFSSKHWFLRDVPTIKSQERFCKPK